MQFKQSSQCREHIMNVHDVWCSKQFCDNKKSAWSCNRCGDPFTRWYGVKRHLALVRCSTLKNGSRKMLLTTEQIEEMIEEAREWCEEEQRKEKM